MTGFVASPPPPAAGSADEVEADGWFPAISMAAVRTSMRIGDVATDPRLRDAILGGMMSALVDLGAWKDAQVAAGYASLADVPAPELGGQSRLVQLWRRAVSCYAAAELAENFRSVAATVDGRMRAEEESATAGDLRRNGLQAIRDLLGRPRARVTLL